MKNWVLLLILLSSGVSAQSNKGWGFLIGGNIPNVSLNDKSPVSTFDNPLVETSNLIGISAGIFADIYEIKNFVLSSELNYRQLFTKADVSYFGSSYTANYMVEYISPALIVKYIFDGNSVKPSLSLGLNVNVYAGDRETSTNGVISTGMETTISESLKKIYVSPLINGGAEIKASENIWFVIGILFSPAVSNFYEDSERTGKSNSIELRAGSKFRF